MPRSLLPVDAAGVEGPLATLLQGERLLGLVPVAVLSVLALGLTLAWNESRTELAYLRASEPVPAVLTEAGAWQAEAGEPDPTHARAYASAEVTTPQVRQRWLGLVGAASLLSMGFVLTRRRESALPAVTGRPVPLVPSLA